MRLSPVLPSREIWDETALPSTAECEVENYLSLSYKACEV
jgi:hypothetical protein